MSEDAKPGITFWIWSREAVATMARAGMNDTAIACVLCAVRASAIHEERLRLSAVAANNPPYAGIRWPVMEDEMKEHCHEALLDARDKATAP